MRQFHNWTSWRPRCGSHRLKLTSQSSETLRCTCWPRWIFRTIQRLPMNASLNTWCPLALCSTHCASCVRQRSATSCSWSASSATWNIFRTYLRSHTGTQCIGRAINDSHILDSSFQAILENKSNFKNDGPKIQAALQKLAKLETIGGVGVAKYSEAVDEAMALIEKYKPSMYPQATAVE